MSKPLILRKRARIIALIIFFLALIVIIVTKSWWPAIMLALGLPLAIIQYLQGRHFDMAMTLFVFGGAFVTVQFEIQWEILLPVLFGIGGIYILFREWLEARSEKEREMELNKREIEEENGDQTD